MSNLKTSTLEVKAGTIRFAASLLLLLITVPFSLRAQVYSPRDTSARTDSITLKPVLSAGTNLLYDVAITPNVNLELPLAKHWSLLAEYTFPWWVTRDNTRAWQIIKGDLGLRWWPGRRRDSGNGFNMLTGHFLGIDLSAGYYDIEPYHSGNQGEFQSAGLEYGYAWSLGEHWRLNACIAGGWMGTYYRHYTGNEHDTKLIRNYDGRFTWWGPTKVGVTLQYVFTKKKGGRDK